MQLIDGKPVKKVKELVLKQDGVSSTFKDHNKD